MAVVVIGGQTKNVGKTSVVCGLISALPDGGWTAIKISQCGHGVDSAGGGESVAIGEERDPGSGTDSSRYLSAGAVRSLWVRTGPGELAEAMPRIRAEIARARNVILESNSVLGFLRPDVYASVLDPEVADFKASALRYIDRADAVLLPAGALDRPNWVGVSLRSIEQIRRFEIGPPSYSSAEFVGFVAEEIGRVAKKILISKK